MKRSGQVVLSLLATVAVSACSDNSTGKAELTRECVDRRTNQLLTRDYCTPGHAHYLPHYAWYYGGTRSARNGTYYMAGGSYDAARARAASRSYSKSSPSVSRGVIGTRGGSAAA